MGITVLSLFDGISCGMVALERAGIEVDKYIAYEIEHNARWASRRSSLLTAALPQRTSSSRRL